MKSLIGTQGDDTLIFASETSVSILGKNGSDSLQANSRDDYLRGGRGVDELLGFNGHDTLFGGRGDDVLFGMFGRDTLKGGKGADRFTYLFPEDGGDRILDFDASEGDKIVLYTSQGFADGVIVVEIGTERSTIFFNDTLIAKVRGHVSADDLLLL